jgi:two-component system response regulator BaeR
MAERILIVEDEDKIADVLRDYLRREGYETHRLGRGDEVVDWVRANGCDLVLLDLMLPGRSGLDVCQELRTFSDTAIIMVTARVDEIDRLLGLALQADDYICKPFSPREVVARVKAVLRRTKRPATAPAATSAGAPDAAPLIRIDPERRSASIGGTDLGLTTVEFALLQLLASHPGRIFSRDQIMDAIYRDERVVADRTVDSHVKKLRRKIADVLGDREVIRSVYGAGYKYEEDPA